MMHFIMAHEYNQEKTFLVCIFLVTRMIYASLREIYKISKL